jgi:outer membrane protein assembly factor BamD
MRTVLGLARSSVLFAGALGFAAVSLLSSCDMQVGDGSKATLTYTEDARDAYQEAMRSYHSKSWDDARALLSEVRKLFPYSRYATLAELRLADLNFEQEKYADAVSSYREFIQNHRMDRDVEYARYRIAKSLFRDIDETFLLPPAEERDQATALEAYRELESVLRDNPRGRYLDDVRKMRDTVQGRLVRHELYVARFYLRQDLYPATIARIDHAVKAYPGSSLEPEALVLKGETLLRMNEQAKARALFQKVIDEYGGPFAVTARKFLGELDSREKRPGAASPKAGQGS